MKRWLAILLAAVMSVSMLSVNAFGATDNYVDNVVQVPDDTILFEKDLIRLTQDTYLIKVDETNDKPFEPEAFDTDWYVDGTDLVIPLKRAINGETTETQRMFELQLTNAKWYFRHNFTVRPLDALNDLLTPVQPDLDTNYLVVQEEAALELITELLNEFSHARVFEDYFYDSNEADGFASSLNLVWKNVLTVGDERSYIALSPILSTTIPVTYIGIADIVNNLKLLGPALTRELDAKRSGTDAEYYTALVEALRIKQEILRGLMDAYWWVLQDVEVDALTALIDGLGYLGPWPEWQSLHNAAVAADPDFADDLVAAYSAYASALVVATSNTTTVNQFSRYKDVLVAFANVVELMYDGYKVMLDNDNPATTYGENIRNLVEELRKLAEALREEARLAANPNTGLIADVMRQKQRALNALVACLEEAAVEIVGTDDKEDAAEAAVKAAGAWGAVDKALKLYGDYYRRYQVINNISLGSLTPPESPTRFDDAILAAIDANDGPVAIPAIDVSKDDGRIIPTYYLVDIYYDGKFVYNPALTKTAFGLVTGALGFSNGSVTKATAVYNKSGVFVGLIYGANIAVPEYYYYKASVNGELRAVDLASTNRRVINRQSTDYSSFTSAQDQQFDYNPGNAAQTGSFDATSIEKYAWNALWVPEADGTYGTYYRHRSDWSSYPFYYTLERVPGYLVNTQQEDFGVTSSPVAGQTPAEASYKLEVSPKDQSKATITITERDVAAGNVIRVPLVTYKEKANTDATVEIVPGNASTVSAGKLRFAGQGVTRTKTTHDGDPIVSRDVWELDTIIVTELVVGSIRDNEVFQLALPTGYYWGNQDTWDDTELYIGEDLRYNDGTHDGVYEDEIWSTYMNLIDEYLDYLNIGVALNYRTRYSFADWCKSVKGIGDYITYLNGLLGPDEYGITYGYSTDANDKLAQGSYGAAGVDQSVLNIWLGRDLKESDQLKSKIYVDGLIFFAEPENTLIEEDIYLNVKGLQGFITEEKVLVAKRRDYGITLTAGTLPKNPLVSGRYIGPRWDSLDALNDYHKTADVTLKEQVSTSWWGARSTILALPATDNKTVKGAKFRAVKVLDSNFTDISGTKPQTLKGADQSQMYQKDNPHGWYFPGTEGLYLNDGERHGSIIVNDNTITITNVNLDSKKQAEIKFGLYVSVEEGFAKAVGEELKLTVDPKSSAIVDKDVVISAVIAKVIDPVTVTTKVSDLKIGYQFQSTKDIQITETAIGTLLKDKTVRVSISDLVSTDLIFSSDVKVEVTKGDLQITNLRSSGQGGFTSQSSSWLGEDNASGSIVFDILRSSVKEASTITISTVGVKMDRTIPVTNKDSYKVLVWGTAIAENYGLVDDKGRQWKADFNTVGESADYINVVSSADDSASVLTQEVSVTIGQSYYTVNGTTYTMPEPYAPYLSTPQGSSFANTMIPIRMVSYALGIRSDQVMWDGVTKTVTINTPNKVIQFKVGDTQMLVNGVSVPIIGADGKPTAAEMKQVGGLGYTFVPMRALADAFGIPVAWKADTQTAIYNEGANKNTNLANSNTDPVATAE